MGVIGTIDASGGATVFQMGRQSTFETPVATDTRVRFTLPESLGATREFFTSAAPTPQRGKLDSIEISRSAGGELNWELMTEGLGLPLSMCYGSPVDIASAANTDGGVRCELDADSTSGDTVLHVDHIPSGFPSSGALTVFYRTDKDMSKQMLAATNIAYTSKIGNRHFVLASALTAAQVAAFGKEDLVCLYDAAYTGVNTHIIEAGEKVDTTCTIAVLRDFWAFFYYGAKGNSITETFDKQAVSTATIDVVASDEWSGGRLNAEALPGHTSVTIDDVDRDRELWAIFYPGTVAGREMWIDEENSIQYSAVNGTTGVISGIPAANLTGAISGVHRIDQEKVAVVPQSIAAIDFAFTDQPLTSSNMNYSYRTTVVGYDEVSVEVLSANYTLNNNFTLDKVPQGQKERAALPPGQRDVTGLIHVEFHSPFWYNKVKYAYKSRLEIAGIDQLSDINNTGVSKRSDRIFRNIIFTGNTPNAEGPQLIEVDHPFIAHVGTRHSEVMAVIVNASVSAIAGG